MFAAGLTLTVLVTLYKDLRLVICLNTSQNLMLNLFKDLFKE